MGLTFGIVTILSGLVYLVYVRLKEEGKMALVHQSLLLSKHLVWFRRRSNLLPVLGGQEINYCLNKKIFLRPQPEGVPPLPRITEQRSGHPLLQRGPPPAIMTVILLPLWFKKILNPADLISHFQFPCKFRPVMRLLSWVCLNVVLRIHFVNLMLQRSYRAYLSFQG